MTFDRKTFLRMTGLSLGALATKRIAAAGGNFAGRPGTAARCLTMVVDTKKCLAVKGCRQCIQACHQKHNVPEIQDKRHEVKWIWTEPFSAAFASQPGEADAGQRQRPVVVMCNHCDRPPCVRVCPTHATWKREDGIVMMDWHRCIGCRYCMAACPYGSRSFNWEDPRPHIPHLTAEYPARSSGVVEKCTFCPERITEGKPPACVEACAAKALVFGDADDPGSAVHAALRSGFAIRRRPELGTGPRVYYIV